MERLTWAGMISIREITRNVIPILIVFLRWGHMGGPTQRVRCDKSGFLQ